MRALKWSISHAVFVTEIDDEHKEIFAEVSNLRKALSGHGGADEMGAITGRLAASIEEHFAHEERLMRAARYGSVRWHKQLHDSARRRLALLAPRTAQGDAAAAGELVAYLTAWLRDHTRLADRMMGAFLRNRQRICKITFRAGTKPADACTWVDARGDPFNPAE